MKLNVLKLAGCFFALGMMVSQGGFAEVTITRLANEGVILDDGVTRIMIDGMVVEPYSLYGGLPPGLARQFEFAQGVFADIDLALASHRHHDHNQPVFSCIFMRNSSWTRMYSSRQVLELMRERCRNLVTTSPRVTEIDPVYNEPVEITSGTATISAFLLSHGSGKYAQLQNYGHLVHMGGVKILHIGDAAMQAADFEVAGLDQVDLDVALIPFWFFQPGPGMAVVERFMDAPLKLAVHIPPGEMGEVSEYLSENYPEVQVLVEPGDSLVVSPSPVTTSGDGSP